MRKLINKYNSLSLILKASLWFTICSLIQKGISVITIPIFTRIMSAEQFGQYSVYVSWMEIVTVFVTLRLTAGVYMQGMVKFEDDIQKFSSSIRSLFTTLVVCFLIIYLFFQSFFNSITNLTTLQMILMFVTIWSVGIYGFWANKNRLENKYKELVILTLVVAFLTPVVSIFGVIFSQNKVIARILCVTLVSFIFYGSIFIIDLFKSKKFLCVKYWKYAILFNLPLIPHYLSSTVLNSSDRIMIDRLVGSEYAGIYSLAYSLSTLMFVVNSALMQTLEPWLYKSIKSKNYDKIEKLTYPAISLVAIINLFLIAFAPEVIRIFAPSQYYAAIWIIPPVAMSVYFMFTYPFFATFEFYYEKRIYILFSTLIAAVLNIGLNFIFIPMFGYLAAGYTTLLSYMIYALMHYLYMKKICKEKLGAIKVYNIKILLLISFVFLILGFVLLTTYSNVCLRYGIILLMFLIIIIKRKFLIKILKNNLFVGKKV